ncbi:MAG: 50S ribosomal protein L23 [Candidatus Peribacteraceae bacterium]|nr:50S ribosomal protein L23 [Candidatus Peribacteraceae bacterium]
MDLSRIILGPVVTEKAERLKAAERHTHTIIVAPHATKIDVQKALERFYSVEVESVRIVKVRPKTRVLGNGKTMEKRHAAKKALVTLAKKSKQLDLASFGS